MLIYDFYELNQFFWFLLLGILLFGLVLFFLGAIIIGNEEAEYNGQIVLIRQLPIGARLIIQGIPIIVGLLLILYSSIYLIEFCNFYFDCNSSKYMIESGPIYNVRIERSDSRSLEEYDIEFTIGDFEFITANRYSLNQVAFFEEGTNMLVQYGYIVDNIVIYRIYLLE